MLKDYLSTYYFDGNYNCAESLLRAANDYYKLELHDRDMKLVAGFGAGMQTGNTCGALLSAISVLSMKYVEKKAHESADIKPVTELLTSKVLDRLNSIECNKIKPLMFKPEIRCLNTVNSICDALEETFSEYDNK